MNRREVLKSTFGALALASGIAPAQNAIAQTRRRAALPAAGTPDYARLSNAVLNNHGFAAASVWNGTNTGTLKSDDLVKASLLLRLTADHFGEIGVNAYLNTQLSQPPSGTVSPDVAHAIGERIRSFGISLTDAQIQGLYPSDPERGRRYLIQVGIPGVQLKIADSIDLVAKQLRLQEIATACEALLPLLPSSPSDLTPVANSYCSDLENQINSVDIQHQIYFAAEVAAELACLAICLDPATTLEGCVPCEIGVNALETLAAAYLATLIMLLALKAQKCV